MQTRNSKGQLQSIPLEERFWSKVQRLGDDECWPWQGALKKGGYPHFMVSKGHFSGGHRIAYQLVKGPIPEGAVLDHLCRNRVCVNPAHLDPVGNDENLARGIGHGHETHCPHGHEYNEANTYWAVNASNRKGTGKRAPFRVCRACNREHQAARRAAMRSRQ